MAHQDQHQHQSEILQVTWEYKRLKGSLYLPVEGCVLILIRQRGQDGIDGIHLGMHRCLHDSIWQALNQRRPNCMVRGELL